MSFLQRSRTQNYTPPIRVCPEDFRTSGNDLSLPPDLQHSGIQYRRPITMQSMRHVLTVITLIIAVSPALAQDEKKKQEVQVTGLAGWAGLATRGDWTPALIDLDNRGKKDLDLLVSVTWAAGYSYQQSSNPTLDGIFGRAGPVHQVPVSLPAKSRKRISVCLLTPDGAQCNIWAFAQDVKTGRTLARGELTVRLADVQKRIVGIVGQSRPEGLDDESTIVATLPADELPE